MQKFAIGIVEKKLEMFLKKPMHASTYVYWLVIRNDYWLNLQVDMYKDGLVGTFIHLFILHGLYCMCVSLNSASFVIYPEIKATEVPFQS